LFDDFCSNFVAAVQVELPRDSPFWTERIHWTSREEECVKRFARKIFNLERGEKHNSSIFVGMKGVGKTTLYVSTASHFSVNFIV
jgi:hypothetical protein